MVIQQTAKGLRFEADAIRNIQKQYDDAAFVPGEEYDWQSNMHQERKKALTREELTRLIRCIRAEGYGVRYVGGTE